MGRGELVHRVGRGEQSGDRRVEWGAESRVGGESRVGSGQ